jgi:hypothetical protein
LDSGLSGPQSRSGRGGEEKNSQPLPGLESYNEERKYNKRIRKIDRKIIEKMQ